MSLRTCIFGFHAQRFDKRSPRSKQFVDYAHAVSFLIIYECDPAENYAAIEHLAHNLRADNKQVNVVGYVHKKQHTTQVPTDVFVFDKSQTTFLGKPYDTVLNAIAKQQFDIVIDLTKQQRLPLLYVLLHANARCKISGHLDKYHLADFIIELPDKQQYNTKGNNSEEVQLKYKEQLFASIIRYLKEIKQSQP